MAPPSASSTMFRK